MLDEQVASAADAVAATPADGMSRGFGGDQPNWHTGDAGARSAVGGATDLAIGAEKTVVTTQYLTRTGQSKIVTQCSYPLPFDELQRPSGVALLA